MSWFYSLCFHLKEKANIFIISPTQVWSLKPVVEHFRWISTGGCFSCQMFTAVWGAVRILAAAGSRRESLFCVQFGRFVCNLWLQLWLLWRVGALRLSGGCLSAVMRRSGAACNFAALCGNVASDRGMPEDKASSVRPSEGMRVTPAAPCGTPGLRGFPPRAAGVLEAVGKQHADSLKSFDSEFSRIDEFIDQLEDW